MSAITWRNALPGDLGSKQFAVQFDLPNVSTTQFLHFVADGLNAMNDGELWRIGRRLRQPPPVPGSFPPNQAGGGGGTFSLSLETPPGAPPDAEARLFSASAQYSTPEHKGQILLQASAQRHIDGRNIGWVMTFADQPGHAMLHFHHWRDWVAEQIVAFTLLHVSDSVIVSLGYPIPDADPTGRWAWLGGSWQTGANVGYRGWSIRLG